MLALKSKAAEAQVTQLTKICSKDVLLTFILSYEKIQTIQFFNVLRMFLGYVNIGGTLYSIILKCYKTLILYQITICSLFNII